ncbi:unnamed protein product, partial [Prorocentrum cordatum]
DFKQGVEVSFACGVCCAGLSDADLDAARATAFRSVEIRPSGKSRTAVLATIGGDRDPVFKAACDSARALHRAVWEQWLPRQALDKAFAAALAAPGSWADCRGPVEAALFPMRRAGWGAASLDARATHDGIHCGVSDFSPWSTKRLLGRSCDRWQAAQLSKHDASWLDVGINFGQPRRWTASGRGAQEARRWPSLSSEQRGYLRSCIVDGQWTHARKYGNNPRHLCCSAIQDRGLCLPLEIAQLLPQEDIAVAKCPVEGVLFPAQQFQWRPPSGGFLDRLRWCCGEPGEPFVGQPLRCDGPLCDAQLAEGRGAQAAAAVVELPRGPEEVDPGVGSHTKALGAPLVGPWQSIEGAEPLAVLIALHPAAPPIELHCDAGFVVDGINLRGEARQALHDFGGVGPAGLTIAKIKGRAAAAHVARGIIARKQRRGNYAADHVAGGIAHLLRAPAAERQRQLRAQLFVDGAAHWAATAGAPAAAESLDSTRGYVARDEANKDRPPLAERAFGALGPGPWRCTACPRTARTTSLKQVLYRSLCVPKIASAVGETAPPGAAAGAALAAAAAAAAAAADGADSQPGVLGSDRGQDPAPSAVGQGPATTGAAGSARGQGPAPSSGGPPPAPAGAAATQDAAAASGLVGATPPSERSSEAAAMPRSPPPATAQPSAGPAVLVGGETDAEDGPPRARDALGHIAQRAFGYVLCAKCHAYARERLGSIKAAAALCAPHVGEAGRIRRLRADRIHTGQHPASSARPADGAAAGEAPGLPSAAAPATRTC